MDQHVPPGPGGLPARELLRIMALSREGDRREGILMRQGRGWFHVAGMGHEAIGALAYLVEPGDFVFPYYRDRALMLALGMSNYEIAMGYFAREGSYGCGRSMPGHYTNRRLNAFTIATPTGAQCLPAAGAAWGLRLAGEGRVALACIGDAAIRQGEFYEAMSLAIQEMAPLVMVIQDNGYGISTRTAPQNPYSLNVLDSRWVRRVDGRDPFALYEAGRSAFDRARLGDGPTVLWCEVDRLASHTSSDDHRVYRSPEELAEAATRDPLPGLAHRLISEGTLTEDEWKAIQEEAAGEVDRDYKRAEKLPAPSIAEAAVQLLGACETERPAPPLSGQTDGTTTMVAAIRDTLQCALDGDQDIIMFGEDIADPKGGVFGLTKGLSSSHAGRVVNSPLAEATIVGSGVGLAAVGRRPVFEVQFVDFMGPALNALLNQAATVRWRSHGEWTCPLTIISPCGAYLPGGGAWHSQTNEGFWAHVPGLRVVCPSTPEDAAGLLWTCIYGDDPTLFLIPKHIMRKRVPFRPTEAIPLGKSVVRREGSDLTLVTWGNGTELAEIAAERCEAMGLSMEVLDLRSIVPCDWEGISASVEKTGRLIVLHEDSRTGGFGDTIVAEMTSRPERWNYFLSPPQIVAREDTHVPFCPDLEYGVLPDLEDLLAAVRVVMES